jgi:hypothetical protein
MREAKGRIALARLCNLQLLTTHYRPTMRLLDAFGDTSAATALAAKLSADVMAARPESLARDDTRACSSPGGMDSGNAHAPRRSAIVSAQDGDAAPLWLGHANLGRALLSAANDTTLMVEDALLPFRKDGSLIKTRDMNPHHLPWPQEELRALDEEDVELRITLSYFIEPNPGERGWTRRHRYASHALRFSVKRSLESLAQFRQRINRAADAEEAGLIAGTIAGDDWVLGPMVRDRGSVHSDIWRGSAAALADRDAIAASDRQEPGTESRGSKRISEPSARCWRRLAVAGRCRRRAAGGDAVPTAAGHRGGSTHNARLGLGASRAAPSQCDSGAAVGGIPHLRARRLWLFLVLRPVPRLGRAAESGQCGRPTRMDDDTGLFMAETVKHAGTESSQTCMGLFLSSGCFGLC